MSIAAQDVGIKGLEAVGIQWSERVEVRSRVREALSTVLFSLESPRSADLIVDTVAALPDHVAVLFVRAAVHPRRDREMWPGAT